MTTTVTTVYLVATARELKGFRDQVDRDYFAKPVAVEIIDKRDGKMYTVTDPVRGHTYPALRSSLKSPLQLTNRQRAAAGIK